MPKSFGPRQILKQIDNPESYTLTGCSPVHYIRDRYCCVVTTDDIESAEKLCIKYHNQKATEDQHLKVNIHPYSYRGRPLTKEPRFE